MITGVAPSSAFFCSNNQHDLNDRFSAASFLIKSYAEDILVEDASVESGSRQLNMLSSFIVPVELDRNAGQSIIQDGKVTVNCVLLR
jgi:hypothetical protein